MFTCLRGKNNMHIALKTAHRSRQRFENVMNVAAQMQ